MLTYKELKMKTNGNNWSNIETRNDEDFCFEVIAKDYPICAIYREMPVNNRYKVAKLITHSPEILEILKMVISDTKYMDKEIAQSTLNKAKELINIIENENL